MMERFVFIHGSSVGQSVFIPVGGIETLCNDIANKYFQGRTLRQKESSVKLALFVDLYKGSDGAVYCIYSFVNNECRGANGRDGQYLALSIVCKGSYIYPEIVYKMLYSAYSQMFEKNKILGTNQEGKNQFVISQFKDEEEYLSAFCRQIGIVFDEISNGAGKTFDSGISTADYDSWRGTKVSIDLCNSMETFGSLCKTGRLYISEEYESPSQKIKVLEERIDSLRIEKEELERRSAEAKHSEKSKVRDEIEELHSQIKQKDAEIESLSVENCEYKVAIESVRNELDKYAKVGKAISNLQGKKSQYESKSKKDLLKICLLFIILILVILSSIMNYVFFRDIPPFFENSKETSGIVTEVTSAVNSGTSENPVNSLVVTPKDLQFEAQGGSREINITTDGEWKCPDPPNDWIRLEKQDYNRLLVSVEAQSANHNRECTFMLKAGNLEKQISITQKGHSVNTADYNIIVTNSSGRKLKQNDFVQKGEVLSVTVANPSMAQNGFGWKYSNCSGNDKKNVKEVRVTVGDKSGQNVVISYGDVRTQTSPRTRFILKLQEEISDSQSASELDDTTTSPSENNDNVDNI